MGCLVAIVELVLDTATSSTHEARSPQEAFSVTRKLLPTASRSARFYHTHVISCFFVEVVASCENFTKIDWSTVPGNGVVVDRVLVCTACPKRSKPPPKCGLRIHPPEVL